MVHSSLMNADSRGPLSMHKLNYCHGIQKLYFSTNHVNFSQLKIITCRKEFLINKFIPGDFENCCQLL